MQFYVVAYCIYLYIEDKLKNLLLKTWKISLICILIFTIIEEYTDIFRTYQQYTHKAFLKQYNDYCSRNIYPFDYNEETSSLKLCPCVPDGLGLLNLLFLQFLLKMQGTFYIFVLNHVCNLLRCIT